MSKKNLDYARPTTMIGNANEMPTLQSHNQLPAFVPKMFQQQDQISQHFVTTGSHETLKRLNYTVTIHSNRAMRNLILVSNKQVIGIFQHNCKVYFQGS